MKKAQAAMEFLMTYGWAILIILIVLASLFYLGVFSPPLPNVCTPIPPFNGCDIKFSATPPNEFSALFSTELNAANFLSIDFRSGGTDCNPTDVSLTSGVKISFTCAHGLSTGDRYAGDAVVSYTLSGSAITHTLRLGFSGTAE